MSYMVLSLDMQLFANELPLDRKLLYLLLLGAVGDEATELRFEDGEPCGTVLCTVAGVDHEATPIRRDVVQKEIMVTVGIQDGQAVLPTEPVSFLLNISGTTTEVVASFQPHTLVLSFPNPKQASTAASDLLTAYVSSTK